MDGIMMPPTYGGSGTSYGSGSNYVGNYSNLPAGISNAGSGANSAYTRNVQGNELVGNQLNDLLSQNGQYMQQARQSGMNTANDRGMLNSSIAAGNSQQAAIQAGLPIAQGNAAAYGTAAGQNLDALNQILANTNNNRASMYNADAAAGASRYSSDLNYKTNANQLAYNGQQAGIGRSFADYMTQQGYKNQMQQGAFNLGSNLLTNNDNFTHQMYLNQANNPFAMQNPQALQGYIDYGNQNNASYYDNLIGYATNGGQNAGNWYENSPYYTSQYGQNQGNNPYGTYNGGNP